MKNIYDIPVALLRQIYIKNGKFLKFTDKFNRKLFMDLALSQPDSVMKALYCCLYFLKHHEGDLIKTITVRLDYKDEICKKLISTNKNLFYKSIGALVELGILYKLEPRVYIVSMDYICVMSNSQKSLFHSTAHSHYTPMNINNVPTRLPTEPRTPHVE